MANLTSVHLVNLLVVKLAEMGVFVQYEPFCCGGRTGFNRITKRDWNEIGRKVEQELDNQTD